MRRVKSKVDRLSYCGTHFSCAHGGLTRVFARILLVRSSLRCLSDKSVWTYTILLHGCLHSRRWPLLTCALLPLLRMSSRVGSRPLESATESPLYSVLLQLKDRRDDVQANNVVVLQPAEQAGFLLHSAYGERDYLCGTFPDAWCIYLCVVCDPQVTGQ